MLRQSHVAHPAAAAALHGTAAAAALRQARAQAPGRPDGRCWTDGEDETRAYARGIVVALAVALACPWGLQLPPSVRGAMSAPDDLDDDELELLYERTQAIVQAIDADGDGSADVDELSAFFEKLRLIDGSDDGDPPETEALAIIEGAGDGTVVMLDELCEVLMDTFVENMDMLDEIEELLAQQEDEDAAAMDNSLSTAWKASHRADAA
eukprot:SAG31_NODE_12086_length_969_cov_66.721839_2_plen_208_part_01